MDVTQNAARSDGYRFQHMIVKSGLVVMVKKKSRQSRCRYRIGFFDTLLYVYSKVGKVGVDAFSLKMF